jgi:RecB family exonuclease
MDFEIVFIVGMVEGAFPPRVGYDAMLPEAVREQVRAGDQLPTRRNLRAQERWEFLAALASGSHERVLTYPRTGTTGRSVQYPSRWLLEQAVRQAGIDVSAEALPRIRNADWLTVTESAVHGIESLGKSTPADIHDFDLSSVSRWRFAGRPLYQHPLAGPDRDLGRGLNAESNRSRRDFTEWDGKVSELAGRSPRIALNAGALVSPTRMERWAACPFSFFLGDVLGLSALESPEETLTISPMDRGALVHTILELFVSGCMEDGSLPGFGESWTDSHRSKLMAIAEIEFRKAEDDGITGRRIFWDAAKRQIMQDLDAFLEEDSQMRAALRSRPAGVELAFGFGDSGGLPAAQLVLPSGVVLRFRGMIDRVDESTSGEFHVIDYKTGGAESYADMAKDALLRGTKLQLPVYALAVAGAAPPMNAATAFYWFVSERGGFQRKSVVIDEKLRESFSATVSSIAEGISKGLFPANPGGARQNGFANCSYCDFDKVCPSNRDLAWERKSKDASLAAYAALTGVPDDAEEAP